MLAIVPSCLVIQLNPKGSNKTFIFRSASNFVYIKQISHGLDNSNIIERTFYRHIFSASPLRLHVIEAIM